MKRVKMTIVSLSTCALATALVTACGGDSSGSSASKTVHLGYISDLGNAPVMVRFAENLKNAGYKLDSRPVELGATQTTALASGKLDISTMGFSPFLVAVDKSIPVGIVSGISVADLYALSPDPAIKTLADIKPSAKIAVGGKTAATTVILQMGAKKELGDAHAFDKQFANASHDVALRLLLTHQAELVLEPHPYDQRALKQSEVHVVGVGSEWVGTSFNLDCLISSKKFHDENPKAYAAVKTALAESINWINSNTAEAATQLQQSFFKESSVADVESQLTAPNFEFTPEVRGLSAVATFMQSIGLVSKLPGNPDSLVYK